MHNKFIRIPNFDPRPYQLDFFRAMDNGCKRAVLVWHRRAGKEVACFNWMIKQAFSDRVGTYVYFFPTSTLGRRILWDGANKEGKRFLDYIPKEIILGNPNSNEMKIRLINGSVIQIIGSDQIINVGINPIGCVFSEFSLQDPKTWNFVRPILRENGGWAVFNFTPRGKNYAYDLFLMAEHNPEWFCQKLTIKDTNILTDADMDQERREGMSEHLIQQEYYCSFEQGIEGAYYAKLLSKIDNQLCSVPFQPYSVVDTYWDLGVGDETVILLVQNIGNEIHIINMYRNHGEGLNHYAKWLKEQADKYEYTYGTHYAPHDIQVRELGSGAQTRLEIAKSLGIHFKIVPNLPISEGIELARGIFPRVWIDKEKCNFLIKSLENYHKTFNERLNVYSDKPLHNWASHCFTGETEILTRYGTQRIMDLPNEGEILTLYGWRKYKCPRITRKNADLVEVIFQDGTIVKCTEDHLFLTEKGWKSAKNLQKNFKIQSFWMQEPSILKDNCIDYGQMKNIFQLAVKDSIEKCGKVLLVKYLKNVISIIKMEMLKIIDYVISNVWMQENILLLAGKKIKIPEKTDFLMSLEKKLKIGTHQKKVDFGIKDMQKEVKVGQNGKENQEIVYGAKRSLIALLETEDTNKNTVIQIVKQPIIESVKKIKEKEDVWCISVPDIEHFSLSNGAIVHNCSDAFRYLSIIQNKKSKSNQMSEEDANSLERAYAFRHL